MAATSLNEGDAAPAQSQSNQNCESTAFLWRRCQCLADFGRIAVSSSSCLLTSSGVARMHTRRSAEIVLSSLLLEKIQFLKRFQSVDSKNELAWSGHTKSRHVVLQLNIIEDDCTDVMGVLLGEALVGS